MIKQAPIPQVSPFEDTAVLAALLRDCDLNKLIDSYVIGRVTRCNGYCEYQLQYGCMAIYRCTICGATLERTLTQQLFSAQGEHERRVPAYTADMLAAWPIVEAMRKHDRTERICFQLLVRAQCRGKSGIFGLTAH